MELLASAGTVGAAKFEMSFVFKFSLSGANPCEVEAAKVKSIIVAVAC